MLKNIPEIISPELMKRLMEMGHGDELIIADGNYPAHSQGVPVVRADGHDVASFLQAILPFFPLDSYSEKSVGLMEVVKGDTVVPVIWDTYKEILRKNGYEKSVIGEIERFAFYERSKKAALIIATSDRALYGNILLKKGVV
ncbi:MAG: L-fucose mutarotase [Vallitaleaceae bacterium]|nr:L-fucose mutarotase [Vallitaleaceae bacterium]